MSKCGQLGEGRAGSVFESRSNYMPLSTCMLNHPLWGISFLPSPSLMVFLQSTGDKTKTGPYVLLVSLRNIITSELWPCVNGGSRQLLRTVAWEGLLSEWQEFYD